MQVLVIKGVVAREAVDPFLRVHEDHLAPRRVTGGGDDSNAVGNLPIPFDYLKGSSPERRFLADQGGEVRGLLARKGSERVLKLFPLHDKPGVREQPVVSAVVIVQVGKDGNLNMRGVHVCLPERIQGLLFFTSPHLLPVNGNRPLHRLETCVDDDLLAASHLLEEEDDVVYLCLHAAVCQVSTDRFLKFQRSDIQCRDLPFRHGISPFPHGVVFIGYELAVLKILGISSKIKVYRREQ